MFKNLKIKTKLNLVFIIVFIISMAVIGIVMQTISSRMLRNQIFSHLETITELKARHLSFFLEEEKDKVELIATHSELTTEELKEIKDLQDEFYEIFVLSSEGIITVSSDESKIGYDKSNDDSFIGGKEGTYIKDAYFSEDTQKQAIAISTPFQEGVLVVRIETTNLERITLDRIGLGETGKIYLINKEGYMITPSRFKEDTFLKEKINSINAENCLSANKESEEVVHEGHDALAIFSDYRGINVLGAHRPIHETGWCLLVEIDEKEAMAPVLNILLTYLIVIVLFVIVYLILINRIAKVITGPILKLRNGTEIIKDGNLNHRVGFEGGGEIGQLARSFDIMTATIKESYADVNKKVAIQIKEIISKKIELEKQQKAILNILEDVKDEKELTKKEKDKIDIILDSIGDGVFVVDKNLRITIINQVALDLSKCFKDKVIGHKYKNVLRFVNEETGKINDKFIVDAFESGKVQEMTNHTSLIRKDGTKVPVSDSSAPFRDKEGNVIGCVVVFRDVSKEREVDRMKTEFVSIASHQLRTPLTSISWFTEMLLSKDVGKINKKQEDYLHQVYNSNKRMIKLVNDLLNVSRIETGKMVVIPEMVQIEDLIETVLDEVRILAKSNNISIIFKKPKNKLSKIKLDPNLISQIVQNLLSNAIRYNKKNGKIVITVDKIDKEFLITVADTGIGIPKESQRLMFTKFFRADNAIKKEADGNGLGLYVNKAILEVSGGKIWFESQENKGTTFYVTIPVVGMKIKKGIKPLAKS